MQLDHDQIHLVGRRAAVADYLNATVRIVTRFEETLVGVLDRVVASPGADLRGDIHGGIVVIDPPGHQPGSRSVYRNIDDIATIEAGPVAPYTGDQYATWRIAALLTDWARCYTIEEITGMTPGAALSEGYGLASALCAATGRSWLPGSEPETAGMVAEMVSYARNVSTSVTAFATANAAYADHLAATA